MIFEWKSDFQTLQWYPTVRQAVQTYSVLKSLDLDRSDLNDSPLLVLAILKPHFLKAMVLKTSLSKKRPAYTDVQICPNQVLSNESRLESSHWTVQSRCIPQVVTQDLIWTYLPTSLFPPCRRRRTYCHKGRLSGRFSRIWCDPLKPTFTNQYQMWMSNFNQFINKVWHWLNVDDRIWWRLSSVTNIIIVNIDKLISDLSKTSLLYRYLPER